jgi:hypothetical protein
MKEPFKHPAMIQNFGQFGRRDWLRIGMAAGIAGSLGLSPKPGLSLGDLRQTQSPISGFGRAKTVIMLFHLGGPPQHETWDPKPLAPESIRGNFKPISTTVPGIQYSELMPLAARHAKDICVLRSCTTADNAHSSSGYWMLTGVPHQPLQTENAKVGFPNDHPSFGALIRHLRPDKPGVPSSITLPDHIWNTGGIPWPGQDGGFLGRLSDPWLVHCDPSKKDFEIAGLSLPDGIEPDRIMDRAQLWETLSSRFPGHTPPQSRQMRDAFAMIRTGPIAKAFRINEENEKTRERYGANRWGQSLLLTRRLVEAGVPFIQVNWTRLPGDTDDSPAWDTHNNNAKRCKDHLLPISDLAFSALIEDLKNRGLLDSTLVVWTGEFGRSPKHNGGGGRDHWGHAFSGAICGAGVRGGQVIGSTDRQGAFVKDDPVSPQDLRATMLHAMGIGPETELMDPLQRPIPACRGVVIPKVFEG